MLIVSIDASFVWVKHQTKSPHTADSLFGREKHALHELYMNIIESPYAFIQILETIKDTRIGHKYSLNIIKL